MSTATAQHIVDALAAFGHNISSCGRIGNEYDLVVEYDEAGEAERVTGGEDIRVTSLAKGCWVLRGRRHEK